MACQRSPAGYLASTYRFRHQREAGTELDFFRLVVSRVALPNEKRRLQMQEHPAGYKLPHLVRLAGSKVGP